ncbi:ATP-dependent exoDNAse (exonuclease V) beta subunit (contains helicase and exonuclease domains) [Stigmatella aurantiaca]|uniref:DNA 3'-5' helicase n=1 Tax=Stigmatella aurantiaca TaxID=41 RepID=A0A1H7UIW3_STIAU|nr:UvrD-helicase domain-containing protein [Stigmatella aurantiaca]SEL96665.1 ATP-dependent exoDNAse (exonuclease V) beta subunit (contains helicase and exonuclease domains) [Stigmatella aurantiaca]
MSTASSLALEQNLALMAGAGAGKTYSLVTMVLHLLAGAREAGPALRPARLCMLTFTDKAAAEMRSRTRARLDALAQAEAKEPELRASLERLSRPFPTQDTWRALREELGAATVGTFHSLCGQLLRRAPAGLGIDPAFEVLDELEASSLVQDVCERVVLDALEKGSPEVSELCQELTFSGSGFSEGLVSSLRQVYAKLREEGLRAETAPISRIEEARAALEALFGEGLKHCASARELDAKGEWRLLREACERALEGMTPENFSEADRLPALKAAFLADGRNFARLSKGAASPIRALYWLVFGKSDGSVLRFEDAFAAWRTVPFESTFRALLGQVEVRHETEFSRRNVFDFTALLVKARDLLRDHPTFRRQVQERMGALLVDEFQDTNRLQLDLVLLLSEQRDGGPRTVRPDEDLRAALPLEPAFLCAVGDRKQSIYEFRGADVSVFAALAEKIVAEGGQKGFLQHNRRSVPALLDFFNRAFAGVLVAGQPPRPYEVAYVSEEDDLSPVRPEFSPEPAVERLLIGEAETASGARELDADAVARRLRLLLAPGAPPCVAHEDGQRLRLARGGDVAILLRTFTHLEVYRQALIRHGVPHRVLRGRGFYGAQEVLDLASLLALLADPEDALALAAVLRSPLVGLSDAALFRLSGEKGLTLAGVEQKDLATCELEPSERLRLERFLTALPSLRRERDRLGVKALLQVAMDVTGYREAMAGTPYAEQASANIDKLLALAGRRDERGTGGCVAFARELRMLVESDPTEAQADLLDAGDPRAVQLLTIHRAKGLEWPIVVVPGLGGKRRSESGRIHFERTHGLVLRPWLQDSLESFSSTRFEAVKDELDTRGLAEYRRLLYVALTRARDLLLLSGTAEKRVPLSWWTMLDGRLGSDAALRARVRDIEVAALPPPADPLPPGADEVAEAEARVEAAIQRVRGGAALEPVSAVASAEALQDFMICPRRYRYIHQLGLSGQRPWELPAKRRPLWVEADAWGHAPDASQMGAVLLRELDFRWATAPTPERRAHLEALLQAWGHLPDGEGMEAVLAMTERFLDTPFARLLAASPPSHLHRGLTFSLALSLPGAKGQVAVEGELDLLWETPEGEAWVVAYRRGKRHPLGPVAFAHELVVQGLAAKRLVQDGVTVRAGVAFLGEPSPEPEFLTLPGGLTEAAEPLEQAVRALVRSGMQDEWPSREAAACQALHCGFAEHCHPSPRAC